MSEGEGSAAPGQGSTTKRVPCLHNPTRHELDFHLTSGSFVWVDLEGPTDEDLDFVAERVPLHPLTVEDAKSFHQRPKIEDYENYVSMVIYGVDPDARSGTHLLREVHMILSGEIVVTIHRHPYADLDAVRERFHDAEVRSEQFLVYQIMDAVMNSFVPVLGRVDDDIDTLEEQIIDTPREEQLRQIFSIKRDLVAMRRVVTPMRDMMLRRADHIENLPGFDTDDKLYFRDLYDGLIRTSDNLDAYRDLLSGTADLYLSTVANRQGEVNRQLTIVASIFLPLSFLTGFFGQNFSLLTNHIIESDWSFWVLGLGLLALSTIGFAIWFRRRGWIGRDATGGAASAD